MSDYKNWIEISCNHCRGYGVVSVYSATDFEGPGECYRCGGAGRHYVTPADRFIMYPGGPLIGYSPGSYEEELRRRTWRGG